MIRKCTRFLAVLAASAALASIAAPGGAGAQELKFGFVNISRLLDDAPQAEEARTRIQAEFAPLDQEIVRMQRELRTAEERLIRDGDVMTDEARVQLEREVFSLKRDLNRSREEFREDLNLRRNQELQKLQEQVVLAIQAMARAEEYDLVISDGVLFASERVDITDAVLKRLTEEHEQAQQQPGSGASGASDSSGSGSSAQSQ